MGRTAERIAKDSGSLILPVLHPQIDRCAARLAHIQELCAGRSNRFADELVDVLAAGHSVHLGMERPAIDSGAIFRVSQDRTRPRGIGAEVGSRQATRDWTGLVAELTDEEYREFCLEHGGGAESLKTWLELRRVLFERRDNGWRFETGDGDPFWAYGLAGEAHMTVSAQRDWVTVYTHHQDDVEPFTTMEDFDSWLPEGERTHAGFSPTYWELRAFLESKGVDEEMLRDHDEQLRRQSEALDKQAGS